MLELMRFADELVDAKEFKPPAAVSVGKKELDMAKSLISSMTSKWDPEKYTDDYRLALEKLIEEKVEHPDQAAPKSAKAPRATKVIDLVAVLQQSLAQSGGGKKGAAKPKPVAKEGAHKKAA
jgi:DNA end-binding protein Ku